MAAAGALIVVGAIILAFIISALPLYFAVKFMGGKTSIFKTIIVNLLAALIVALVNYFLDAWAGLIAFILVIWLYREFFRLKWLKALLAWLLQFVFLFVIGLLLGIFGIVMFALPSII